MRRRGSRRRRECRWRWRRAPSRWRLPARGFAGEEERVVDGRGQRRLRVERADGHPAVRAGGEQIGRPNDDVPRLHQRGHARRRATAAQRARERRQRRARLRQRRMANAAASPPGRRPSPSAWARRTAAAGTTSAPRRAARAGTTAGCRAAFPAAPTTARETTDLQDGAEACDRPQ